MDGEGAENVRLGKAMDQGFVGNAQERFGGRMTIAGRLISFVS